MYLPYKNPKDEKQWKKDWYQKNKHLIDRQQFNTSRKLRRRVKKEFILEALGNKCSVCGYDKCDWAIEVHCEKVHEGRFCTLSWAKIKELLPYCVLLCSIHHRELHFKLRNE